MVFLNKYFLFFCLLWIFNFPLYAVYHYNWCDGKWDGARNDSLSFWEPYYYLDCGTIRVIEKYNLDLAPHRLLDNYKLVEKEKYRIDNIIAKLSRDIRLAELEAERFRKALKLPNLTNVQKRNIVNKRKEFLDTIDKLTIKRSNILGSPLRVGLVKKLDAYNAVIWAYRDIEQECRARDFYGKSDCNMLEPNY